jgi:hypothetical protein
MEYKYFVGCVSLEDAKDKMRKLAMSLHPDKGGNQVEFSAMIEEYNYIKDGNSAFPIKVVNLDSLLNIVHKYNEQKKEEKVTNLSPEELNYQRAKAHFDRLRANDLTFDIIDEVIKTAEIEGLRKLWVYAEIKKNLELNLEHFKYATWRLKDSVATANTIYKSYLNVRV